MAASVIRADSPATESWRNDVRAGRSDAAVEKLRHAIDQPGGGKHSEDLALLYEQLGEMNLAVEAYQQAVVQPNLTKEQSTQLIGRMERCKRQRPGMARFPSSVEASSEIRQVEGLLEQQRWPGAFNTISTIMERFEGQFLQQATGASQGLWGWARQTLEAISPEGKEAYEAWSANAWQDVQQDGSADALRRFLAYHPAPSVESKTFLAWADLLADQGRVELARGLLARQAIDPQEAETRRTQWDSLVPAHDVGQSLEFSTDTLQKWVADANRGLVIPNPPVAEPSAWSWAGDANRLFVARDFRVEAYDLKSAKPLWCHTTDQAGDRYPIQHDVFDQIQMPRHKWTGAWDRPGLLLSPVGLMVVEAYHFGDPQRVIRTLVCLDPETGFERWRLDRDPLFEDLRVCSDPVYSGGKVLLVASSRGRFPAYWLCALDGRDGRVLWRHHIAIGATPTNCLGRGLLYAGQSGPTVSIKGEVVYYTTHMGAVAAVDRDLGQPIWAVSYPRISRFGPMTRGPLALLERRTEPMLLTEKYLVMLPRDHNGVLVIDRHAGRVVTILRSFDMLELIDATDESVVVTTLSGQIKRLAIESGKTHWQWTPPGGEAVQRPALVEGTLLVPHGMSLTSIDIETGQAATTQAPAELQLHRVTPGGHWLAATPNMLRVVSAENGTSVRAEPDAIVAQGQRASDHSWRHEFYVPGLNIKSRLVNAGLGPTLLVSDQHGLSAYRLPDEGKPIVRLWFRDHTQAGTVWAVSPETTMSYRHRRRASSALAPDIAHIIAWCGDGQTVSILDIESGGTLASGQVEGIAQVDQLHVVGDKVLVQSIAQLAWVEASPQGVLLTSWLRDFGEGFFEAVYAGAPETLVFVHGMGHTPAKILRLRADRMDDPIAAEYNIPTPKLQARIFDENDRHSRYPVGILNYHQDELPSPIVDSTMTRGKKTFPLAAAQLTLLDYRPDVFATFRVSDYFGMCDLQSGEVTIMSPFDTVRAVKDEMPAQQIAFLKWITSHCGKTGCLEQARPGAHVSFRLSDPEFSSTYDYCVMGGQHTRHKCISVRARREKDNRMALGRMTSDAMGSDEIEPILMDRVDSRLLVSSHEGALILRKYDANDSHEAIPGKFVSDLMQKEPDVFHRNQTVILDGDASEWPEDTWHTLDVTHHVWPASLGDSDETSTASVSATFQWMFNEEAIWLAVRVEDDHHVTDSAAIAGLGDQVEVMISNHIGLLRNPKWSREDPVPLIVSMTLADHMPIAWCRALYFPTVLARPVGAGSSFEAWCKRRYGFDIPVDDQVMIAADREDTTTTFEVRFARSLFKDNGPGGFDIRVGDNDGQGLQTWLNWSGSLNRIDVYPLGIFSLAK